MAASSSPRRTRWTMIIVVALVVWYGLPIGIFAFLQGATLIAATTFPNALMGLIGWPLLALQHIAFGLLAASYLLVWPVVPAIAGVVWLVRRGRTSLRRWTATGAAVGLAAAGAWAASDPGAFSVPEGTVIALFLAANAAGSGASYALFLRFALQDIPPRAHP